MKTPIYLSTGVALALAASPALAQTKGTWSAIGKPRCAATYSTNLSANAMATELIFPVSRNFTTVTPVSGSARNATNEELQSNALVITGDELKRLIGGASLQYQLSGGIPSKKTSVEVSGEGLSAALAKVKVLCNPASATQATIPSDSTSATKPNPTNTLISQVVQANQAANNKLDTSTTKVIQDDKTATQQSTKPTIDSAICGEVLLGRMKQAKMSNAAIMDLCHK